MEGFFYGNMVRQALRKFCLKLLFHYDKISVKLKKVLFDNEFRKKLSSYLLSCLNKGIFASV